MTEQPFQYTKEQEEAITLLHADLCVDASAGSGKTRVLIDRIVHILESGEAGLDDIVAITFTDKAAGELKARLRHEFRRRASPEDPEVMTRWRDRERALTHARISTIHAFCAALLREHALEFGQDPNFTVLDRRTGAQFREVELRRAVRELLAANDTHAVRAAEALGWNGLHEALAGLFQKRDIVERKLEECDYTNPEEIVDAWTKSVEAWRSRLFAELPGDPEVRNFQRKFRAFDGSCTDPDDGRERLRQRILRLLDEITRQSGDIESVSRTVDTFDHKVGKPRGLRKNWPSENDFNDLKKLQEQFERFLKRIRLSDRDEAADRAAATLTRDVVAIYNKALEHIQTEKRRRGLMDFDDLLLETRRMLKHNRRIRERAARSIRHLLIDEFQDTDSIQYEIVRLLSRPLDTHEVRVFVVGDAKQSIYGFRGADVEVFVRSAGEAQKTIFLSTNFRSTRSVVAFINEHFERYRMAPEPPEDAASMTAVRTAQPGAPAVEFLCPRVEDTMDAQREAEARLIAARIQQLCAPDTDDTVACPRTGLERRVEYHDIAILLRARTALHIYEKALADAGIPIRIEEAGGFYDRQEIHDVVNLIKAAIEPWNETALLGFLRGPAVALPDQEILRLAAGQGVLTAFHSQQTLPDESMQARLDRARNLVAAVRDRAHLSPAAVMRHILNTTGLEAVALTLPHGARRAANLRKLCDDAAHSGDAGSLTGFVRFLEQMSRSATEPDAPGPDDSSAVRIMTVHQAKGLEFPVVIVADIAAGQGRSGRSDRVRVHRELGIAAQVQGADGNWQATQTIEAIDEAGRRADDAENRRILYVAMTRARDRLIFAGRPSEKGASRKSWFVDLDRAFQIRARDNGAHVEGKENAWRGIVTTTATGTKVQRADGEPQTLPGFDRLREQTRPAAEIHGRRTIVAVTSLLSEDESPGESTHTPSWGVSPGTRGAIIHEFLQRWDFSSSPKALAQRLLDAMPLFAEDRNRLASDIEETASRLIEMDLCKRVRASRQVERELPFILQWDGTYLTGTIDLLLDNDCLVDYKTGRPDTARMKRYECQLQVYAEALARIRDVQPEHARLVFVDVGSEVDVDVTNDARQLAMQSIRARIDEPASPAAP